MHEGRKQRNQEENIPGVRGERLADEVGEMVVGMKGRKERRV